MSINWSTGILTITAVNKFKGARIRIAVIGLGYVGLPLAVEFAKVDDVALTRKIKVKELNSGIDSTERFRLKNLYC